MPQEINLNVSPYFDDFDSNKNYQKILFKPSFPVQARELTGLQSILQNQIEVLGNQKFKEGSAIVPGEINYNNEFFGVEIDPEFLGISVENYINFLVGKIITGSTTNIKAKIAYILDEREERGTYTLYLNYLTSGNNNEKVFSDSETLTLDETVTVNNLTIQASQGFANTISTNCSSIGSCVIISNGIYYIRGNFVNVDEQILILNSHSNSPSFRVGFEVIEEIITINEDNSLADNAQGFNNFAAPGADRLKVNVFLSKRNIEDNKTESFIELFLIENGKIKNYNKNINNIETEIDRRIYETSGDFYINPFSIEIKETLNDLKGNGGIFLDNQLTYGNNAPSEKLGTYKISPGKAVIKGKEVNIKSTNYIDFEKPRTTKSLVNQEITYSTGTSLILNRVYGSPNLNLSNPFIVELRDTRIGSGSSTPSGKEIGLARVYDYKLKSNQYNTTSNLNQWEISLFDIQTYSELTLNEPINNLSIPTKIEGSKSGASGFLRYEISDQTSIITVYNLNGSFISGEEIKFSSINETRVITNITNYDISDVKSISGIDENTLLRFNADTLLYEIYRINSSTISAASSGISTITSSNFIFQNQVKVGDIVSYSSPGLSVPSYASVTQVNRNNIVVSPVTTVPQICSGSLPQSNDLIVSDLNVRRTSLKTLGSNKLYTFLPNENISNIDLISSNLTIKKEYSISITNNASEIIYADPDFTFLPFLPNRYILSRSNGQYEVLTSDKFIFSPDFKELVIRGLGANDTNAKLIVTLNKSNVKNIIKNKNRIGSLIIDKSSNIFSGTGESTVNDGLSYGNYPYGTRVQDKDICLLKPEINKVYGVFESYNTNNPLLPSLVLSEISTTQSTTADLLLGEEITGLDSGAVAILVEKVNDSEIGIVYLNSNKFKESERILFEDTKVEALISLNKLGSKDITDHYDFDFGSKDTIYDFSKLIRKNSYNTPTKKIKVIYEFISISSSETGDITNVNSYNQFNYCDIPLVENNKKSSDIIDIRPRVSDTLNIQEDSRSPFEFLGRFFNTQSSILASNETIRLSYSYYLPRIDSIFLSKEGNIFISNGVPSDSPERPLAIDDSLEISNVYLPPYLCNINDAKINTIEHKLFKMNDIYSLENRVKNLEYYTKLSTLELKTNSLKILDSNGIDRFKCGFIVDDFSDTKKQINYEKNSIDPQKGELRPSYETNQIDLIIGSNSLIGVGTTSNSSIDFKFVEDLIGNGIKKTGQLLTLDYKEDLEIQQPFATRYESLNSNLITSYIGSIDLFPSSDIWGIDDKNNNIWNSWEFNWTGMEISSIREQNISDSYDEIDLLDKNDKKRLSLPISDKDNLEDPRYSYKLRSRNLEFICNGIKPFTRVYGFFDGVDVNKFITPKLIEINMISGSFLAGETVYGISENYEIRFRICSSNHKNGPITNPIEIYTTNPYNRNINVPFDYTFTSTILNLDTYSISYNPQGSFYGCISNNMILRGLQSGAQAKVSNVRLLSDDNGLVSGSLYIPDYKKDINPKFDSGPKTLTLTTNSNNSIKNNSTDSFAETIYFSTGKINTTHERVTSIRNVLKDDYRTISPLAQSFFVAEESGIFVTKIDLFFKSKDLILPLTVQIRTMSMGIPTEEIVPFSEVFVNNEDINTSSDASIATTIKFKSPVYLNPNKEFSIVLFSQSSDYEVWTSRTGEVDITTLSGIESQQIISTNSSNVGSFYKTNNDSWNEINYENIKFNLYKASFISEEGTISFFNPDLNQQISNLESDSLIINSKKIIIGLQTSVLNNQIQFGNTIKQQLNTAKGNYIGFGGSALGNLGITNAGIGYTPFSGSFTFNNVKLQSLTGNGRNARANITIKDGVAIAATVSDGGLGYLVGDTLTILPGEIGINSLGRNILLSISQVPNINQLILDNVIGDFEISQTKQVSYINFNEQEILLNSGEVYINNIDNINPTSDGLHIKVNHNNHGMHSIDNNVSIKGVSSDLPVVRLDLDYPFNLSSDITLTSTENFAIFEGQPVSPNNPGYVLINDEIISYYGVSGNTLTNIERGIDQTNIVSHFRNDIVQKYEIGGVSLRRINKTHKVINPINLNSYYIKLDMSSSDKGSITDNGPYGQVDRSIGTVYPKLYLNESKSTGGSDIYASQNIQYEIIKPIVQTLILPGTNITSFVKTTTATSISGNEKSYLDSEFIEINLNSNNYFNTPRLIASKVNEQINLNENKSFNLNLNLSTKNKNLSPVIDLDRVGAILTTNRINKVSDFSYNEDQNEFTYVTKNVRLKNSATSLKVIMESYVNIFSEIQVYYSISNNNSMDNIYNPFPGYNNLDDDNKIIDNSQNDGLSDEFILKSDIICNNNLEYKDYTFTVENLPSFKYFSIKIVGKSSNQACPPIIRDFSVIALA
jgi:hypothetical protein